MQFLKDWNFWRGLSFMLIKHNNKFMTFFDRIEVGQIEFDECLTKEKPES